ncbi:MAG: ATP F0F1 synthase subunit B [Hyphomicrobiales bacterium]|nr:ATP F0F1 synthase subunit B [Hyphomicrobiales bacterium]
MPQLEFHDWAPQLVWLAISFVTLYFIMARVALPRIGTVIEERRDRIAADLDSAEQLKKETEEAIAAYEQALADARAKAHTIAQETRDKLKEEVEAERTDVEAEINKKTAQAEARIQASKTTALSQINDVAAETAEAIVKELIGGRVTKAELNAAMRKTQAS